MKYEVHFCLVSGQATPNLAPILAAEFRPIKVVLYASKEMKKQTENLASVLKKHQIPFEILNAVDAYDMALIQSQIIEYLDTNKYSSIALNVTGGTKPMAIAAQEAFRMDDKPVFYVNSETNAISFLDQNIPSLHVISKIRLPDYLESYGFDVVGDLVRTNTQTEKRRFLTTELIARISAFSTAIGTLNYYANLTERSLSCEVQMRTDDPNWDQVIYMFEKAGMLTLRDKTLTFTDEASRAYVNGGWLEEHTFSVLQDLPVQDKAINLRVMNSNGSGHAENEMDIAFLAKNRLHLIECKAKIFKQGDNAGADALYKLDSLTALGGINTKAMLLCYRKLRNADKQRAKDLKIKTLEGEQLKNLRNELSCWIGS